MQKLLTAGPPAAKDSPDAALYRQLASLRRTAVRRHARDEPATRRTAQATAEQRIADRADWGLDPALFGKHPERTRDRRRQPLRPGAVGHRGSPAGRSGRRLRAGHDRRARPRDRRRRERAARKSSPAKPTREAGLLPSEVTVTVANGQWTCDNRRISYAAPILVNEGSAARKRIEAAFDEFRQLFPAALCYTKIVPVDEVVTLTLFYREDDHLARLMLDDAQQAQLDRLWDELHFVSQDALTLVDAFAQLMEFATQDADPKVFEPLRKPINDRAAAFRKLLVDTRAEAARRAARLRRRGPIAGR